MEGGNRAEAERWLYTANKLLSARDLHGARSFAIRARESDPTFDASELLLAVIDTLLAGEARINDHHTDWYGILQILRYTTNIDHIANQYRRLALLLDPNRNPFAFSGHAFSLVHDAWSVLSNPAKKAMYDSDLRLHTTPPVPPPQPQPLPQQHQYQQQHQTNNPTPKKNPRSREGVAEPIRQNRNPSESAEPTRQTRMASAAETDGKISFWTLCPYCYVYYEYPKVYEECTLRCQSCRRGFHAVVIRSPPLNEIDSSFCTWGFFPLGFSGDSKDVNGASSNWNPIAPLFPSSMKGSNNRKKNWVYYDEEQTAAFIDISDPSDDDSDDGDWRGGIGKRKGGKRSGVSTSKKIRKDSGNAGGREAVERPRRSAIGAAAGNVNEKNVGAVDAAGVKADTNTSKKAVPSSSRRRGAGNLDLNVEFSNDVEEPSRVVRAREGNPTGNAEDNIEGIGFFEGLDEFLSSLPILNVVGDDKTWESYSIHKRFEVFDHVKFDAWVEKGVAPAIEPSLKLYEDVLNLGYKVILLTGRKESHRAVTVDNLINAGFRDWHQLILRSSDDKGKIAVIYKSEKRSEMEKYGYRILDNKHKKQS
ncbi:Chaperone DnaJ-domain superfamily protein [Trifolium repens]|nr:Chaperone DnaJ-domain superfamily protein [Trifolium repens]